jgi:hypothetical protein
MLSDSEELKKELARVADDIYSNTKEEFGKDTGASHRFLERVSEFKVQCHTK